MYVHQIIAGCDLAGLSSIKISRANMKLAAHTADHRHNLLMEAPRRPEIN